LLADNYNPGPSDSTLNKLLNDCRSADNETSRRAVKEIRQSLGVVRRNPRVWNAARFDNLEKQAHNNVRAMFGDGAKIEHDETRHHAAKFFGPRDKIWVYVEGNTRYLDDLSEIVSGMPDKIWRGRIYSPTQYRDNVKSFCERWLRDNPCEKGASGE
jgi:hypothetical protein